MSLLNEYRTGPPHAVPGIVTGPTHPSVAAAACDELVGLGRQEFPVEWRLPLRPTGWGDASDHGVPAPGPVGMTGPQRSGEFRPLHPDGESSDPLPVPVRVRRLTELGGDERVALHRLLGAIGAGDRAGCFDGLELLLLTLGRVATAEVVREAGIRPTLPGG